MTPASACGGGASWLPTSVQYDHAVAWLRSVAMLADDYHRIAIRYGSPMAASRDVRADTVSHDGDEIRMRGMVTI